MKIFIDSDVFIALLNKDDALHQKAKQGLLKIEKLDLVELFSSWDVVDEVSTKISYFLSKKQAKAFLEYIEEIKTNIIFPTPELSKEAKRMFSSLHSKRVSMTDCMNMSIVDHFDLDCIFSFDKIYEKQGQTLIF